MTKNKFNRPMPPWHSEWLSDAYNDLKFKGPGWLEPARLKLVEGQLVASLRTPSGRRYKTPQHVWDQLPIEEKLYPLFEDGLMKMELEFEAGSKVSKVEGWIYVGFSELKEALFPTPKDYYDDPEKAYKAKIELAEIVQTAPTTDVQANTPVNQPADSLDANLAVTSIAK